jgi:hypothetical protein
MFSFLTIFAIPIFLLLFLTGLLCFSISKKLDWRQTQTERD